MKIESALYSKLMNLNTRKIAIDQFVKQVTAEGRKMMEEAHNDTVTVWAEIAKKYELDLSKQEWVPSNEKDEIVLIMERHR